MLLMRKEKKKESRLKKRTKDETKKKREGGREDEDEEERRGTWKRRKVKMTNNMRERKKGRLGKGEGEKSPPPTFSTFPPHLVSSLSSRLCLIIFSHLPPSPLLPL